MQNKYFGVIYSITNIVNNKIYIGQTITDLASRWRKHKSFANHNCGWHLSAALRKYGPNSFVQKVLRKLPVEKISEEYLNGVSTADLGRKYHIDQKSIMDRLVKFGTPIRNRSEVQKLAKNKYKKEIT